MALLTKLNIYVNEFGSSQLAYYILMNLSKRIKEKNDISPFVFYENLQRPPMPPNFALMQMAEGWGQHGIGIATSVSTVNKMKHFPALSKRYFYVWDLEWMRMDPKFYNSYAEFYLDEDIPLIVRCESHARLIENCFNRTPAAIIPNFNVDSLLEFISKGEKDGDKN